MNAQETIKIVETANQKYGNQMVNVAAREFGMEDIVKMGVKNASDVEVLMQFKGFDKLMNALISMNNAR